MPQPTPETTPSIFVGGLLAMALPVLLAFNLSPSSTVLNQLLAVAGWGALLWLVPSNGHALRAARPAAALLGMLALLMAAVVWSWSASLPSSLALSALASLACAAVLVAYAQCAAGPDRPDASDTAEPLWIGLLVAGVLSAVIAVIQVFAPGWPDGEFIARSGLVGRAVGNLRQPNHLSTLLLWSLMALVPLAQAGRAAGLRLHDAVLATLATLMVLAVVLTASRTGVLGVLMLGLWGAVDKRLRGRVRIALLSAPVVYVIGWALLAAWAHATQHTFGGEARLGEADLSSSRFGIWANAWSLVKAQPWTGVGFGEFNFAWSLTPFPGRPVAFFDHTHNVLLQFLVELGLPLAALLTGLMLWALWQALVRSMQASGPNAAGQRAAFMIVLLAGVHSLLEYPLWYTYFLLPTAWAWGHALRPAEPDTTSSDSPASHWPMVAGGLILVGTLFAGWDYSRVVVIYAPGGSALPLATRIQQGHGSVFYGHHADYAAATTTEPPAQALAAFQTTTHALLDTRLMIAWARALADSGRVDEARYLVDRLREFRNAAAASFLAECDDAERQPRPFQCEPASDKGSGNISWRNFTR
ncbi:PglL family O-oligosaccharyltransferase [Ideonella margarita]|uniref:Wzy polymerase domain-containing protein n=1 Tax=Ideonella margarita TaxID=2984191 RepID=A0ABU9C7F0_9BURK